MKVVEKDSDRTAEVNVFVEGQVPALKEYGEYIDPRDKAICCYVALYEGDKPRIRGQFSGTVSPTCTCSTGLSDQFSDSGRGLGYYCGRSTSQGKLVRSQSGKLPE